MIQSMKRGKNMKLTHAGVGNSQYSLQEYYEKDRISKECQNKVNTSDISYQNTFKQLNKLITNNK